MLREEYDYIIVGCGLAGATLAMHLHEEGKKIAIFTGTQGNTSSMVAAGLYNPITGRKMVKTWRADSLFSYLDTFYKKVERDLNADFLHKKTIYRPFVSAEEQNEWMGKSADDSYTPYVGQIHAKSTSPVVKDAFGGLALSKAGYLDIPVYLKAAESFLEKNQTILQEDFDAHQLEVAPKAITYKRLKAKILIFCEGTGMVKNHFFDWLPLRPVKGEILFIRGSFPFDYILNRGVFVLPVGDDIYKVGSTYDHHDLTLTPTEKAKKKIVGKLREVLDADFEVVDQVVGLRPATKDRRPFLGMHPQFETIGVFNGLGTKGVSLAPYWGRHFVEHLEQGKKLDPDVNISRHFSLYSESH